MGTFTNYRKKREDEEESRLDSSSSVSNERENKSFFSRINESLNGETKKKEEGSFFTRINNSMSNVSGNTNPTANQRGTFSESSGSPYDMALSRARKTNFTPNLIRQAAGSNDSVDYVMNVLANNSDARGTADYYDKKVSDQYKANKGMLKDFTSNMVNGGVKKDDIANIANGLEDLSKAKEERDRYNDMVISKRADKNRVMGETTGNLADMYANKAKEKDKELENSIDPKNLFFSKAKPDMNNITDTMLDRASYEKLSSDTNRNVIADKAQAAYNDPEFEKYSVYNKDFARGTASELAIDDKWYIMTRMSQGQNPDEYYEGVTSNDDKYDYLTQDEVKLLNYFYNTGDLDSFDRLLDMADLEGRRAANHEGLAKEYAEDHPIASYFTARANTAVSTLPETFSNTVNTIAGTNDKYGKWNILANETGIMDSSNAEKLGDKLPLGEYIYQAASSGGDMLNSMALGGGNAKVTQLLMSSQAANRTFQEARERGIDDGEAYLTAVLSGSIEALTEKYSIEAIMSKNPAVLRHIAQNFVTEGSEEMASDILNEFVDRVLNGDKSNYEMTIKDYMSQGMSESEAKSRAAQDFGKQMLEDGFVGSLSGLGFGSITSAPKVAHNLSTGGKYNYTSDEFKSAVRDKALNSEDASTKRMAEKLYAKEDAGKKVSNYSYGELTNRVAYENGITNEVNKAFEKLGVDEESAAKNTDLVMRYLQGDKLTKAERETVSSDESIQEVISQAEDGVFDEAYMNTVAINDALDMAKNEKKAQRTENVREVVDKISSVFKPKTAETNTSTNTEETTENGTENKVEAPSIAPTNDSKITFNGDRMMVQTSEGLKPVNETKFESKSQENAYRYAQSIGNETDAQIFLNNYESVMKSNTNINPEEFTSMYNEFYNAGLDQKSTFSRFSARYKDNYVMSLPNVATAMYSAYNSGTNVGVDVRYSEATKNVLSMLSKQLGANIKITDDDSYNGYRETKSRNIFLSKRANKNMVSVFAHEYTHDMESKDPNSEAGKAYAEYKETVLNYYKNIAKTYDELAEAKRKLGYTEEQVDAEIVADATADFLLDEKVINEICSKDVETGNKIINFLKKMIKEFQKLLGQIKGSTEEARILSDNIAEYNKALEKWIKAVKLNAAENLANENQYSVEEVNTLEASNDAQFAAKTYGNIFAKGRDFGVTDEEYSRIDQRLKKNAGEKIRSGERAFILDNLLVYNKNKKVTGVITVECNEDKKNKDLTYTTLLLEDILRYEKDNEYAGTSIEEYSEARRHYYENAISISYNVSFDSGSNLSWDARNELGKEKSVRNNLSFHFEDEQDGTGNIGESKGSKSFSLKDSEGNTLSEGQQKYFANSKALDENGDLQVVYHGTVREFYTFDKSFGNIEGDMGAGFYFTNNKADVERNYANEDGADLTNKIEQEADYLEYDEEYEDMDHDEIVEALRKKYITADEPITMETYLNIQNPCYVGDNQTYLFADIYDDLDIDDYEDEDDYYQAIDDALAEKYAELEAYLSDAGYADGIEDIGSVLFQAAEEGGITLQELKDKINEYGIGDEEGKLAGNEIARLIVEFLGYDGIIDSTVSQKFRNMGMSPDTVHYIVFNSNQAKLTSNENPTNNEDVRYSKKAYHAGDLGKSEGLWNMLSGSRNTGHFGTGTYFVGNQTKISEGSYGKRPKETVDFDNYNLFKPKNTKEASKLHDGLEFINNNIRRMSLLNHTEQELHDMIDSLDDSLYDLQREADAELDDIDDIVAIEVGKEKALKDIQKVYDTVGMLLKGYEEMTLTEEEAADFAYETFNLNEKVEDFFYKYNQALEDISQVEADEKVARKTLLNISNEIMPKLDNLYAYRYEDSPSTRFMKAFGYEGIDVTDTNLDNTTYGSVIYDLKGEDLARKKEIGTAKFSMKDDFDELEFFAEANENTNISNTIKNTASILEEGFETLKQLKGEKANYISKKEAEALAKKYKQQYNSNMSVDAIRERLESVFAYIQTNGVSYDDMLRTMKDISLPVLEDAANDSEWAAQNKEYTDYAKNIKIKLSDKQKKEIAYQYGSVSNFKREASRYLTFDETDGIYLDNVWSELVDKSGGWLEEDANSNMQPSVLLDSLKAARYGALDDNNMTLEERSLDMALNIYTDYFSKLSESNEKLKGIKKRMADQLRDYKKAVDESLRETVRQINEAHAKEIQKLKEDKDSLLTRYEDYKARMQKAAQEGIEISEDDFIGAEEARIKYEKLNEKLKDAQARAEAWEEYGKEEHKKYKDAKLQAEAWRRYKRTQAKESKEKTATRNRIKRIVDDLSRRLVNPTENRHVPTELVRATIDVLQAINTDTGRSENLSAKLASLKQKYEDVRKQYSEDAAFDESTQNMIEYLQTVFEGRSLINLSKEELDKVLDVVKAIQTQVRNESEFIRSKIAQDRYEATKSIIEDLKKVKGSSNSALGEALNKGINTTLNATRFTDRVVDYNDDSTLVKLVDEINEGSHQEMQIMHDVANIFRNVTEGKENQKQRLKFNDRNPKNWLDTKWKGKDGNNIKVPASMRVSLAMHMMNEDNMKHIIYGGLRVPNAEFYKRGDIKNAYAKGEVVRFMQRGDFKKLQQQLADENLTAQEREDLIAKYKKEQDEKYKAAVGQIKEFVDGMTDYEKKWVEASKEYFHKYSGEKINDTSLELNGYKKAVVDNYFPIKSDPSYTRGEVEGLKMDKTIEGWGNLKSRVGGTNPMVLEGIDSIVDAHSKMLGRYAGLAIPVRNFNKVYAGTLVGHENALKDQLQAKWGESALRYYDDLLADLAGARKAKRAMLGIFRGNFAKATLSVNPSVSIKQAASYPTAAYILGWDAMGSTLFSKTGASLGANFIKQWDLNKDAKEIMKLAEKYSPLLWYRNQGNSTEELGDFKKKTTFVDKIPVANKLTTAMMNWIQNIDTATVATLWKASEYRVSKDNANLKYGTEEYYQEVAKWFNKAVEATQPNYTTLQRADLARNPDELTKSIFMFMTQPLQNFGIMWESQGRLRAKSKQYKANPSQANLAELKSAQSQFARAVSSQVVAALVFNVAAYLVAALAHNIDKMRDDDEEFSFDELIKSFSEDVVGTMVGAIPLGSYVYNFMMERFDKERTDYGIEVSSVAAVEDMRADAAKLADAVRDKKGADAIKKYSEKVLFDVATVSGIPLKNIKKYSKGVKLHKEDYDNGEFGSFEAGVNRSASTNYRRYYKAIKNGNEDKAEDVHEDLVNAGKEDKTIYGGSGAGKLVKEDLKAGNISTEEAEKYLVDMGMDQNDAHFKVMEWDSGEGSDYIKVFDAISNNNRDAIIDSVNEMKKYGYTDEKLQKASIAKQYKEEYINLYNTDKTKAAELKSSILTYYQACGKSREKASKQVDGWVKPKKK